MSADTRCCNCDMPASGSHSLPVSASADIVANDFAGEWAAMPACSMCFALHQAGGDHGPAVLDAYNEEHRTVDHLLTVARRAIQSLARMSSNAQLDVGEP